MNDQQWNKMKKINKSKQIDENGGWWKRMQLSYSDRMLSLELKIWLED